jgi:hypothetical protein
MKNIIGVIAGGVHRRNGGGVAWWPSLRYWWALVFPARDGNTSGRALTPAERALFLAASRRSARETIEAKYGNRGL